MVYVVMWIGCNDQAIELLQLYLKSGVYFSFFYLDYMFGLFKFCWLDWDVVLYFKVYLSVYNGWNFIKEIYQKFGW